MPDLDDGPAYELAEAVLVADFGADGGAADEDNLLAEDGDLEYFAWGAREREMSVD